MLCQQNSGQLTRIVLVSDTRSEQLAVTASHLAERPAADWGALHLAWAN